MANWINKLIKLLFKNKVIFWIISVILISLVIILYNSLRKSSEYILYEKFTPIQAFTENWEAYWNDDVQNKILVNVPVQLGGKNIQDILHLNKIIPDLQAKETTLRFRTIHQSLRVFIEDQEIYNFGYNKEGEKIPRTPGNEWHLITLPQDSAGKIIELRFENFYTNTLGLVNTIAIGEKSALIVDIFITNGQRLFVSIILAVLGLLVLCVAIFFKKNAYFLKCFCYIGLLALTAAIWTGIESTLLNFIFGISYIFYPLSFLSLMFLPLFILLFIKEIYMPQFQKVLFFTIWIAIINIIIQSILHFTGLKEMRDMSIATHAICLISISIAITVTIIGNNNKNFEKRILNMAFWVLSLCVTMDIISYYTFTDPERDIALFSRFGILFYIMILAIGMSYCMYLALESNIIKANTANEEKTVFLARMSHEMRTPLNTIIGMSYLGSSENEVYKKDNYFIHINSASKHLLGIINNVLDMSKIEAGKFEISNSPFNVLSTVKEITSIMSILIENKEIQFEIKLNIPEDLCLLGDATRYKQVILNFLSNSIKFTPNKGIVTLELSYCAYKGNIALLKTVISDTGIGMKQSEVLKLFRAFEQADNTISRRFGGTGLGLAISKSLISLMGGTIEVESVEHIGSTFTSIIPMPIAAGIKQQDEQSKPKLDGKRILLVDDIEINRMIVSELLSGTGAEIIEAENGQEALDKYLESQDNPLDLIFMDFQMPIMDGISATRLIRSSQMPDAKSIIIVAMTANAFTEDKLTAKDAGMNEYLAKPIEPSSLYAVLQKIANNIK